MATSKVQFEKSLYFQTIPTPKRTVAGVDVIRSQNQSLLNPHQHQNQTTSDNRISHFCCSFNKWTQIIAVCQIVYAIAISIVRLGLYPKEITINELNPAWFINSHLYLWKPQLFADLLESLTDLICGLCLLIGIHWRMPWALLIWLFVHWLEIVCQLMVLLLIATSNKGPKGDSSSILQIYMIFSILFIFELFAFFLVYFSYRKMAYRENLNAVRACRHIVRFVFFTFVCIFICFVTFVLYIMSVFLMSDGD